MILPEDSKIPTYKDSRGRTWYKMQPWVGWPTEETRRLYLDEQFHWCTKCEQFKHISLFGRDRSSKWEGLSNNCKQCVKLRLPQKQAGAIESKLRKHATLLRLLQDHPHCQRCEYDEIESSLMFYYPHSETRDKSVRLDKDGLDKCAVEVDKCTVLCKNCVGGIGTHWVPMEWEKMQVGYKLVGYDDLRLIQLDRPAPRGRKGYCALPTLEQLAERAQKARNREAAEEFEKRNLGQPRYVPAPEPGEEPSEDWKKASAPPTSEIFKRTKAYYKFFGEGDFFEEEDKEEYRELLEDKLEEYRELLEDEND